MLPVAAFVMFGVHLRVEIRESAGANRDLELAERRFWADARIFCKELIFTMGSYRENFSLIIGFFNRSLILAHLSRGGWSPGFVQSDRQDVDTSTGFDVH
jgi:hypothetical protein